MQLKHDEVGIDYIALVVDGDLVVRSNDIQNNKNFHALSANSLALIDEFES